MEVDVFRKISFQINERNTMDMVSDFLLGLDVMSVQIDEDSPVVSALITADKDQNRLKMTVENFLNMMSIKYTLLKDEIIEDKDWVEVFKQHFIPFEMNENFFVVPDWEKENFKPEHQGKTVVVIEPGQAFGTGLHPTTSLASNFIAEYAKSNKGFSMLDAGTGSGILSVAAMKKGASSLTAFDIDPVCEDSFKKHFLLNNLKMNNVELFIGDEKKVKTAKYDLVVINIIEKIIRKILPNLKENIGDKLILSGLLEEHYPEFKEYLKSQNIKILKEKTKENWISLLCEIGD